MRGKKLTLQVPGLLDARAFVQETLEMTGQHAIVVQHLFHVDLLESLHVGGQVLDLVVGGRLGQTAVVDDEETAAKGDEDFRGVHSDGLSDAIALKCRGNYYFVVVVHTAWSSSLVLTASAHRPCIYTRCVGLPTRRRAPVYASRRASLYFTTNTVPVRFQYK